MTAPSIEGRKGGESESSIPMEKFLIVGLGNIGPDYEGTRHNIGFRMVDALAASVNEEKGRQTVWEDKRYGFVTRISVKGRQLILLKPSTFMNLSGNAVRYWMQQEKIEPPSSTPVSASVSATISSPGSRWITSSERFRPSRKSSSQSEPKRPLPLLRLSVLRGFRWR